MSILTFFVSQSTRHEKYLIQVWSNHRQEAKDNICVCVKLQKQQKVFSLAAKQTLQVYSHLSSLYTFILCASDLLQREFVKAF